MSDRYYNIYFITVSRIGSLGSDDLHELYAADEASLAGGEVLVRITKIDSVEEEFVESTQWMVNGRLMVGVNEETIINETIGASLTAYEREGLFTALWVNQDAQYSFDETKWLVALGDSRLNPSEIASDRLAGALIVSIQPYYDVEYQESELEQYGLTVGGEASDVHCMTAVCLRPDESTLIDRIAEVGDDFSELAAIVEEWPCPNSVAVREAFSKARDAVWNEPHVWGYGRFLTLAVRDMSNESMAIEFLDGLEAKIEAGHFRVEDLTTLYSEIAITLINYREHLKLLHGEERAREYLVKGASQIVSPEDIERLVAPAAMSYNLGDRTLAQQLIAIALERVRESKGKAKLNRVAKKALDNAV